MPSSSPSFHFPSSTPKKELQPNAHPYAIKTSSTAILSRSNSTSNHGASVGPHRYVPMPTSPPSHQNSPTRPSPTRHRYSRSLTSDLPPALPVEGRRIQRAETLPSTSPVSSTPTLDLPDDPKTWTSSQLSTYLSATLRARDVANLPAPVAKDIASFVNDRRITGKMFLRLSEDDLLQFGINQLWRTTLLNTSRTLRQSTLQGRIWGFGYTPPNDEEEEEEDPGNVSSSSSSNVSSNKKRNRQSNRVKGLVDHLEKSIPDDYPSMKGARRTEDDDDDKHSFSSNRHHRSNSSSPTKRSLPQRGNLNDLFGSPTKEDNGTVAVQEEDDEDSTIKKNAAKRTRETRMLPLPPNHAPMLTPMHTGAGFPLPLTPEHTGGASYTHHSHLHHHHHHLPNSNDFELGFRSPRSPHSGVFVVRHNPASPSNSLHNSDNNSNKAKRLLPFPPLTGETHIHHPKPRRLVGVEELTTTIETENETELSSSSSSAGGSGESSTLTTTEGYETAFESQSASELNGGTEPVLKSHHHHHHHDQKVDEPSVQQLLSTSASSPVKPNTITGFEAWELDLGETVKRISGGGGSVDEIGRKADRRQVVNGGDAARGTKRDHDECEDDDVSRKVGLMTLFDSPASEEKEARPPPASTVEKEVVVNSLDTQQQQQLAPNKGDDDDDRRRHALEEKEKELKLQEEAVVARELDLRRREDEFLTATVQRDQERKDSEEEKVGVKHERREEEIERREREIETREKDIEMRVKEVGVREAEVGRREEEEIERRQREIERREREIEMRVKEVEVREAQVGRREEEVERRERESEENRRRRRGSLRRNLVMSVDDSTPAEVVLSSTTTWLGIIIPGPIYLVRKAWSFVGGHTADGAEGDDHDHRGRRGRRAVNPNHIIHSRTIRRDVLFGPYRSGGYLVLMSIGVCVVALKVLGKMASRRK